MELGAYTNAGGRVARAIRTDQLELEVARATRRCCLDPERGSGNCNIRGLPLLAGKGDPQEPVCG